MVSNLKNFLSSAEKLEQAENCLGNSSRLVGLSLAPGKRKEESQLSKIERDSCRITVEQIHGLMSQVKISLLKITITMVSTFWEFFLSGDKRQIV